MTKTDLTAITAHLDLVTVSFRCYRVHRDLLDRAAALVPERTVSDYIREILPLQCAIDLHEELPNVPSIERGRGGSMVAQAAAKLGMSREEFEQHAAVVLAAQALGADAIDDRPSSRPPAKRPSGFFSRTAPQTPDAKRSSRAR